MSELRTDDDRLHEPSDDPWWTETVWFSWHVPEQGLVGYVYPVFRPNLGIQFGGVVVMGDQTAPPWEEPVHHYDWHMPMQPDLDLMNLRLDNGLSLTVVEPGHRYEITYEGRDLTLELSVQTVGPALVTRRQTPPLGAGHIDQMCRVTGTMDLGDGPVPIDSLSIRDRAWGVRQDGRQPQVFYDWAAATEEHFLLAAGMRTEGSDVVTTGCLMRDGQWSPVVAGERIVQRDSDGQVARVDVSVRDELGREAAALGTVRSRHLFQGYPSMVCWTGPVSWELDGAEAHGEDQDVWSPRRWRDHRRATFTDESARQTR